MHVLITSSAFVFLVTGLALGEITSPNKLTAALTDSKGARVSISPTSVFGEEDTFGDSTRACAAGEATALGERGDPNPFCNVLTVKPNIIILFQFPASSSTCINHHNHIIYRFPMIHSYFLFYHISCMHG